MKTKNSKYELKRILLQISIFVVMFCVANTVAEAQKKPRTINEAIQKNAPILIVGRTVGGVAFGQSNQNRHAITAEPDWISQLAFDVKNTTTKNITYLELNLRVPKTGNLTDSGGMVIRMEFGNKNAPVSHDLRLVDDNLINLAPGETTRVKLTDRQRLWMEKTLQDEKFAEPDTLMMQIWEVHFDDGTGWQCGIELRQNKNNPGLWKSVLLNN